MNRTGFASRAALTAVLVTAGLAVALYVVALPYLYTHLHTLCLSAAPACPNDQLTPAELQGLRGAGLSLDFYAVTMTAVDALFVLVFLAVAGVVLLRRPDDGMALFAALMLVMFATAGFSSPYQAMGPAVPQMLPLVNLMRFVGQATIVLFFFLFPDMRFTPRWAAWLVPLPLLREWLNVYAPDLLAVDYFFLLELVLLAAVQIYRYRRASSPVQRQQTKWVVAGSVTAIASFALVIYGGVLIFPNPRMGGVGTMVLSTLLYLLILIIPLSIGAAILRSHLWDIDLIIRRTLAYGALTSVLALVYAAAIIVLQEASRALTGERQSPVVVMLSTLAIVLLFDPLRRRIQALIDRRFFRSGYDADQVLARFRATARTQVSLDRLNSDLLAAIEESLHPEQASLWVKRN